MTKLCGSFLDMWGSGIGWGGVLRQASRNSGNAKHWYGKPKTDKEDKVSG